MDIFLNVDVLKEGCSLINQMKFFNYLIIYIILISLSCESYRIKPLTDKQDYYDNHSQLILNYRVYPSHYSRHEQNSLKRSIKKLKFKEIKEINITPSKGLYLEVNINYLGPTGTGIGIFSVITFGIIPTYLSEHDTYCFRFKCYNGTKLLHEKEYILSMKQFNWIFVAFAGFTNCYREEKIIYRMVTDFFNEIDFSNIK